MCQKQKSPAANGESFFGKAKIIKEKHVGKQKKVVVNQGLPHNLPEKGRQGKIQKGVFLFLFLKDTAPHIGCPK